jgi:hypothetical protein
VQATCIEEDALRGRGLSGVDVRHDPDVPELVQASTVLELLHGNHCDVCVSS